MRKRGWSIQSDQTTHSGKHSHGENHDDDDDLADHEKKHLLSSFPLDVVHSEEEPHNENGINTRPPAVKRHKSGDHPALDGLTRREEPLTQDSDTIDKDKLVEVAKTKLSKWAARLFDPDRPRGLVQAPQTIPLNDEFLTAFGKREKEYDHKLGRKIDIQQEIRDGGDSSDEEGEDVGNDDTSSAKKVSIEGRKVSLAV